VRCLTATQTPLASFTTLPEDPVKYQQPQPLQSKPRAGQGSPLQALADEAELLLALFRSPVEDPCQMRTRLLGARQCPTYGVCDVHATYVLFNLSRGSLVVFWRRSVGIVDFQVLDR